MAIDDFHDDYYFLSNFYTFPVNYAGRTWFSNEHAYQAMKTLDKDWRIMIQRADTPNSAKRFGRRAPLREDWEEIKDYHMLGIVRRKFADPMMAARLLGTGSEELIEGNWWGDTYWGVCNGKGRNRLGEILMQVREELWIEYDREF